MIRTLQQTDLFDLRRIHERHYQDEFNFDEFITNHMLCGFVVVSNNDRIISAGVVRTIAECAVVTDKDYSIIDRKEALMQILQASMFTAGKFNYDELHAFVQDKKWEKRLKKSGFRDCAGKALVLSL